MTYQQIFSKAIQDCQDVYDETTSFGTSYYMVEEISSIVDYYLEVYSELIGDQDGFRANVFSAFMIDEAEYFY